jgi:hypothetical protein
MMRAISTTSFFNRLYNKMANLNPFSPDFKLTVCDGPTLPKSLQAQAPKDYVPCDFTGLMLQAQFLINAMIIVGVLAAILSFTWAGWLLITGGPDKKNQAKDIFQKVGIGFIMMLTAWFIVYQILDWLVANPGIKSLLGNP